MTCLLLLIAIAVLLPCAGGVAAEWRVVDQPDLKDRLTKAPVLEPELLAAPARGVTSWAFQLVPNPDEKTYDALQWYFKSYSGPTWLYACDLGTGEVKKQRFPDNRQIHMAGELVAPDGKYYIVTPDWNAGMNLFVYDPATNLLEDRGIIVPNLIGETRRLALGPDGLIYGAGNYRNPNKAGAYSLDWKTGKVLRDYGPIGPDHAPHGAWGYWIGVDDEYVYIASGKIPWYLIAVNIKTGEEKLLTQTKAGGDISISPMNGGARASVKDDPEAETKSVRDFVPVPKAAKAGPVLEVAPGRLLGTTEDPDIAGGGLLYGADVRTGEVLFTKKLPDTLRFAWAEGVSQWDYVKGPDGRIYTYVGNVLVRLHPEDARVEPLGRLARVGRMCFHGNDLYLAGDEPVRRLAGIAGK